MWKSDEMEIDEIYINEITTTLQSTCDCNKLRRGLLYPKIVIDCASMASRLQGLEASWQL